MEKTNLFKQASLILVLVLSLSFSMDATAQRKLSQALLPGESLMPSGENFSESDILISTNRKYMLRLQKEDGNLCMYKFENGKQGAFVWCNMVYGFKPGKLTMQKDGNLVIYDVKGNAKWSSKTHPYFDSKFKDSKNKPVNLVLDDWGQLNMYTSQNGVKAWSNK